MIQLVIAFAAIAAGFACIGFWFGRLYEREYWKDEQAMASDTWRIVSELSRIVNTDVARLVEKQQSSRTPENLAGGVPTGEHER